MRSPLLVRYCAIEMTPIISSLGMLNTLDLTDFHNMQQRCVSMLSRLGSTSYTHRRFQTWGGRPYTGMGCSGHSWTPPGRSAHCWLLPVAGCVRTIVVQWIPRHLQHLKQMVQNWNCIIWFLILHYSRAQKLKSLYLGMTTAASGTVPPIPTPVHACAVSS